MDRQQRSGEQVSVSVLICSHNRRALLARTIESLNAAARPAGASVELLVIANACTDDTHEFLTSYPCSHPHGLPLRWIVEPTPGKSHALNRAFRESPGDVIAFVDDDHRVDAGYLDAVIAAARAHPDASLFCGRILPDWDGNEPAWVHDEGPYRIYPLPVPRFDLGEVPRMIGLDGSIPGGGNLVVRREVIGLAGAFATDLGPTGHDLSGSEDADWIRRAMRAGAKLRYSPEIVQFHYVDGERLRLSYVVRKAYYRSKSVMKLDRRDISVRPYMWRKVLQYGAQMVFALDSARRRFFMVRLAAAMGEIHGVMGNRRQAASRSALPRLAADHLSSLLLAVAITSALVGLFAGRTWAEEGVLPVLGVAAIATMALVTKSVRDFSQTGPRIREEVLKRYRTYTFAALARLAFWTFAILAFFGAAGAILYASISDALHWPVSTVALIIAAALAMALAVLVQGCRKLLANPGLIIASWQYRLSRLNTWRDRLDSRTMRLISRAGAGVLALLVAVAVLVPLLRGETQHLVAVIAAVISFASTMAWVGWTIEPRPVARKARTGRPNIVMIGADTLRADRVLNPRYERRLAPNIERLAENGVSFPNCYVPCARTAPSLISLFSGTWPHTHGVRDNFVAGADTNLPVNMLPQRLRDEGYRTVALSDWCGADFLKFSFGLDIADVPPDQWNLRYLIRQGPKDLRLLLSLFCHNRFGRWVLPEIYFLGGVPQTTPLGLRAREMLSRLAKHGQPFMLNVFFSTTHPPFASEQPHFATYAAPDYRGESRYAMARLNDPFDIIRRQGDSRQEFDLEQIIDLYDGCVTRFDAEVGRLLAHIDACGLSDDTIVVIYSDHGMEFFEHETWGQGNSAIGDFSPRVPLIIFDPKSTRHCRCESVVRSIDVAPTLADMVGITYVGSEGVSLRPIIEGAESGLPAFNETGIWVTDMPGLPPQHLRYPDLFELLDVPNPAEGTLTVKNEYRDRVIVAKDRMIRRGRWKLVYQPLENGFQLRLFDLQNDP